MAPETSQTLDRGVLILQTLAREPGAMTVTALAARLGMNRTIVHRLVHTFERSALIRRDADGRLHIGLGILPLASAAQPVLRDAAIPILRNLAEEVGCTTHFTIAEGEEALAIAVVEPSWTDLHVGYRVGTRHLLGLGAAGRAILLAREDTTAGYVTTAGELQSGALGLAAPVLGVPGLEASIGIVTLREIDEAMFGPLVVEAAAALAARLSLGIPT